MATGHFFLTNGSAGAPQITSTAGTLIAMLDWALDIATEGYGGTRGWEKPFPDGTNIAVYRATTGQRAYLRVDDSIGQVARLRMYATMTDLNTGTDPCPNGTPQNNAYMNTVKADSASSAVFFIVGDGRAFTLLTMHDNIYSYRNFAPTVFGEFNSYDALDSYNTILAGSYYTSNLASYSQLKRSFLDTGVASNMINSSTYIPSADNPAVLTLASPDGLIRSSACAIHDPFAANQDDNGGKGGMAHFGSSPAAVYQPYYILDSHGAAGAYTNMFAAYNSNAYIRGILPYIYSTPYAGTTGEVHGSTIIDGASSFRVINISQIGNSSGSVVAEISVILLRESDDEPGRDF